MTAIKKLPGLDGLRAIAATAVLITHVYQIAGVMGFQQLARIYERNAHIGANMVTLFFVISGFIITYLLLNEKERTKTISLLSFYQKRALRIWPIYFLILIGSICVSRFTHLYDPFGSFTGPAILSLVFFYVNVANLYAVPLVVLGHYWSLSVEEQFYLFWPAALKRFSPLYVCLGVLLLQVLGRNLAAFLNSHHVGGGFMLQANTLLYTTRFSCMAIGGIFALAFYEQWPVIRIFQHTLLKIVLWLAFILVSFFPLFIPYVQHELFSFIYACIIISVIEEQSYLLDSRLLQSVGKISYGIYMYHWPLTPLVVWGIRSLGLHFFFAYNALLLTLLVMTLTFAIAWLSFIFIEKPFLKLKPSALKPAHTQKIS